MRVGIFTNNYKPIISGVTVSVENFREGLEKLGHNVFIFAPEFKGYKDLDNKHFRYPSVRASRKAQYPIPLPSSRAKDFLIENKIELIHSQHPWGVGEYALKLAKHFGIPIIFTNHTMYPLYVDYIPRVLPKKTLMKLVEEGAIRYANAVNTVIAPTDSVKEYLIEKGVKTAIYVVPSGVDKKILDEAPAAHLRERFNISKDHTLLLNLSRVGPEKNLPAILRAYKDVLSEFPKVSLVFAGGGAFLEELKKMADDMGLSKGVFFTDTVQLEERGGYFREGDIFVHSSLSETQGLAMVDSLMVGVPIVSMDAMGSRDIVKDGENGLLTGDSPEGLANGILRLLKDQNLRNKLAEGALKSAEEHTIEKTSKKLEEVYKEVLSKTKPS